MEEYTFAATPLVDELKHWMEIAIARNEVDVVVKIADRIRRRKFFSTLSSYGRALSLRWLLEGPESVLSEDARTQKQNLFARFPELRQLSDDAARIKNDIAQLPTTIASGDDVASLKDLANQLFATSQKQERAFKKIALLPVDIPIVFPPTRSLEQIQGSLRPGQVVMDVVVGASQTYVVTIANGQDYNLVAVKPSFRPRASLSTTLRAFGNYDRNKVLVASQVSGDAWKQAASKITNELFAGVGADFWDKVDELIVVPDEVYWYLPFETLIVPTADGDVPIISAAKVRYVPTAGLAANDPRHRPASGSTKVVAGRLYGRESDELVAEAAKQIADLLPESEIITRAMPVGSSLVGHRWTRLIVMDDIEDIESGHYDWLPAQADRSSGHAKLSDWLRLPYGAPEQLILPGFHTAAESSLRSRETGDELLIASCALLGSGCRTVLLGRWRTGGQSNMDLVREFVSQLSSESAASAWQRSIELVRSGEIDADAEPRIKGASDRAIPSADHPFFWGGLQLIDLGETVE